MNVEMANYRLMLDVKMLVHKSKAMKMALL